jgi:hypothetical protein
MLNLFLFNTFLYKKPYMWIYLNERKKTENLDDYRMKIGQTPDETGTNTGIQIFNCPN